MRAILRELHAYDYAIIGLTMATAVIHFALVRPLFILNGIGYLVLLGLIFAPRTQLQKWRAPARWGLLGYAALTIILYFVAHPDGTWMEDGLGIFTKMVELILILVLFKAQQSSSSENI